MTSAKSIEAFLDNPSIAVVGVSRSGKGFGNAACRSLRTQGYRVYPVNWSAPTVDGIRCYSRLSELPERVNAVLVVVPPPQAVDVIREAAAAGIRHVWLQQGAESAEAVRVGAELGLDVISGECILMFAHPTGIHLAHRWLRRLTHGLPPELRTKSLLRN
ncbi:MAG TPA: CoA-binding protein [Vicinamibacterales bacterium]|nr:CoA-binding protein [Vicinamibacterales bacterium]